MRHGEFVGYNHPEKRRSGGAVRITRGPEVVNPVKVVLYVLGAVGLALLLNRGCSEGQNRINETATLDWTTSMAAKLRDPLHSLTVGEKFYPSVEVVAADRTSYERSLMVREGTRVNVRGDPGLGLPAGGDSL